MRHAAIFLSLGLMLMLGSPGAAHAQDDLPGGAGGDEAPGNPRDIEEGIDQLSEGARTLLRGLMGAVDPEMRDLAETLRNWNFEGLTAEDLNLYHPPEILPNGDIILRRKTPDDAGTPLDDEIEL